MGIIKRYRNVRGKKPDEAAERYERENKGFEDELDAELESGESDAVRKARAKVAAMRAKAKRAEVRPADANQEEGAPDRSEPKADDDDPLDFVERKL